jgi:hypothetical protein
VRGLFPTVYQVTPAAPDCPLQVVSRQIGCKSIEISRRYANCALTRYGESLYETVFPQWIATPPMDFVVGRPSMGHWSLGYADSFACLDSGLQNGTAGQSCKPVNHGMQTVHPLAQLPISLLPLTPRTSRKKCSSTSAGRRLATRHSPTILIT